MQILRHDRFGSNIVLAALVLAIVVGVMSTSQRLLPASPASIVGERVETATQPATKIEQQIWNLQERIRRAPQDVDAYALLGNAYLQRARETGDPTYYAKAEQVLDQALRHDPKHVEALIGAGTLALARHDFRRALELGRQALAIEPSVPRIYGLLGDAQVELGQYDAAIATIQTMVDVRPDLASYSRVSYLRELHGDLPGAIMAMEQSVRAGGPTPESTQWVRVQLGNLYFNQGDLDAAEQHYRWALAQLPDYVPAMAGLGRIEAARANYDAAIALYTRATERMPLPEYLIALGDVYAAQGDQQAAQQQYDLVLAMDKLFASNGVNTDLETALFLADHRLDLDRAVQQARAAYAERPSIHAADVLAWTLYQTSAYAEAQRYASEALKLGTRDALKLFHAGMIAHALGHDDRARGYLQQALDLNPYFSLLHADQARAVLQQLNSEGGQ